MLNDLTIRACSPLKLCLGGEDTDVESFYNKHDGAVVNATINLYTHCTINSKNNGKIKFLATDLLEDFECDSTTYIEPTGVLKLHKAIYNYIIKHYNDSQPIDHEVITYSDVPIDSGLYSSSILAVSIIKAYTELLSLPLGSQDISHLAYKIESNDLGSKGKKQDYYSTTFGGFNFMEFQKDDKAIINPLRIEKSIILELEQHLILFDTGVSLESTNVNQEKNSQDSQNTIDSLLKAKQEALNIKEYLLKSNFEDVIESIQKGWQLSRESSKPAIHNYTNEVYKKIINAGALAGKIFGDNGKFIIFLVRPSKRMEILRILSKEKTRQVYHLHFAEEGSRSWTVGDNNE